MQEIFVYIVILQYVLKTFNFTNHADHECLIQSIHMNTFHANSQTLCQLLKCLLAKICLIKLLTVINPSLSSLRDLELLSLLLSCSSSSVYKYTLWRRSLTNYYSVLYCYFFVNTFLLSVYLLVYLFSVYFEVMLYTPMSLQP